MNSKTDTAEAHFNLGNALQASGQLGEAVQSYLRALEIRHDLFEVHNSLGVALCKLGHFNHAIEAFRHAIEFNPNFAEAHNNIGNVMLLLKRLDEALASYNLALEIKPDFVESHNNLGIVLHSLGQHDEAITSCRRALEFNPNYAEAHFNLGNALQANQQLDAAVSSYRRALEINSSYAEAQYNLSLALNSLGQLNAAAASYRRVLELTSDYAEAHNNLGVTLSNLEQLDDAIACYRRALEIKPDYAEAHNNLGAILCKLGRLDDAVACYRRALEINPNYAEAHNNLGVSLCNLGRLDDAVACYRRALEINPQFVDAYSNLGVALLYLGDISEAEKLMSTAINRAPSDVRPLITALFFIPYRRDDPRFKHLEAFYLKRESIPLEDRINLNFAYGNAMTHIEEYDKAFIAYEEGNRLYYLGHPFDEAHDERFTEKLHSFFTPERFKKYAALASTLTSQRDKRVPVFIVGMPRSGTTLMEQILASHPSIFGAEEITTLGEIAKKADLVLSTHDDDETALIELRKLGQEYLDHVWKLAPDARYITDKLPENYYHIGLIQLMLPNAKIIHSMRDRMDTCFSCYVNFLKDTHFYTYDMHMLNRQYHRYTKLMQHWQDALPSGRIINVHYEDVVTDIEREIKRVLSYLGLAWDSACLKFYETKRVVKTASVVQVRKPIYSSSIGRWKLFDKYLGSSFEKTNQ